MEASTENVAKFENHFQNLQRELGVELWENSLTLPDGDQLHSELEFRWEQNLGFTFHRSQQQPENVRVFVSDHTQHLKLFQLLPFWFSCFKVFLCPEQLIQNRIAILGKKEDFKAHNQATQQLMFILEYATKNRASDVHIECLAERRRVRVRVDGTLKQLEVNERLEDNLVTKIKLISGMDIAKKRSPQDGHFPYLSNDGERYDLRTSTIPSVNGEKVVIRILPSTKVQFTMDKMGFPSPNISLIRKILTTRTGMILVTGPTGSGKTTSLYAILKDLIVEPINIITIEDPVEYRIPEITQVEVNEQAGVTFASALKSFLRQDPDVILVGEIRDQETAQIAARAAQTGHLVLSTLHSNNCFEALHRLRSLGVSGDDISSSLRLLISQRLVNKKCRCDESINECAECHGRGFTGRVPLQETLLISSELRKELSYNSSISKIESIAVDEGFKPLRSHGMDMVKNKTLVLAELNSICPI